MGISALGAHSWTRERKAGTTEDGEPLGARWGQAGEVQQCKQEEGESKPRHSVPDPGSKDSRCLWPVEKPTDSTTTLPAVGVFQHASSCRTVHLQGRPCAFLHPVQLQAHADSRGQLGKEGMASANGSFLPPAQEAFGWQ